ncbi:MAG: type I-E CRISPR-associated endoribonuclease Cas2 [Clostridiales bacterium]|nr:type I-E CRISPR-associated endoribonuclease Cas2 [Clostridiales bacterium]
MIVIVLSDCPPAIRGDLTKWFQEINTGVYVGQVNARVRERVWKRIRESAINGRATIAYSAQNEQGMNFHVHNTSWEPIDFDGLKLMLRPSQTRIQRTDNLSQGYSNAAKRRRSKTFAKCNREQSDSPKTYVVLDLETTGVSSARDEIIEIGAVLVSGNRVVDQYHAYVRTQVKIPRHIRELTGITDLTLEKEGKELSESLPELLKFIGDRPMLMHKADFDTGFLRVACEHINMPMFPNECIDTLQLARRIIKDVKNYKLETLLEYFGIDVDNMHRAIADCMATKRLYDKLIEKCEDNK